MNITFQVDRLGQLNIEDADLAAGMAPTREEFNAFVRRFNNLIGQLRRLREPRCCSHI